jgi:uncharacterized membrane protein YdjX (TVP38/TMEM64 family)
MTEPRQTTPAPEQPGALRGGGSLFQRLGATWVLAGIAMAGPLAGSAALLLYANTVAHWLQKQGPAGLALFTVAFAVLTGLALTPTWLLSLGAGYTFGVALGAPAALTGFAIGSLIGYAVARRASGDRVMAVMDERPRWRQVRDALVGVDGRGHGRWRTLGIVTLVRLPPNSPFALTNLVMASVRVPLPAFALGTLLGMAPRTLVAVWLGSTLQTITRESVKGAGGWWLVGAGVVGSLIVVAVITSLAQRALQRVTGPAGLPVKQDS